MTKLNLKKAFRSYGSILTCLIFLFSISKSQQTGQGGQGMQESNSLQNLYFSTMDSLEGMLTEGGTIDFKKAVFMVENAWHGDTLDYSSYLDIIQANVSVLEKIQDSVIVRTEDGDWEQINKSAHLFRWISDTTWFTSNGELIYHPPFQFNHGDPFGEKNWENTFVTSLIKSHGGNCQSMTFWYRILAEELGVKTFMSQAPNHLYIKQQSEHVGWYNSDLSSGTCPTDAWIVASSYIPLEAIRSGLWMDTLSKREEIALCLLELAKGYRLKFGSDDPGLSMFSDAAINHFSHNSHALLFKAEAISSSLAVPFDSLSQNTRQDSLRIEFTSLAKKLFEAGYVHTPESVVQQWFQPSNGKGIEPTQVSSSPQDSVITLTNGQYPESHPHQTIARIGTIFVEKSTGKIVGLLPKDSLKNETRISSFNSGRFLSVDPITSSFPELTPYQYASNSPIYMIDLDGLEGIPYRAARPSTNYNRNLRNYTENRARRPNNSMPPNGRPSRPGQNNVPERLRDPSLNFSWIYIGSRGRRLAEEIESWSDLKARIGNSEAEFLLREADILARQVEGRRKAFEVIDLAQEVQKVVSWYRIEGVKGVAGGDGFMEPDEKALISYTVFEESGFISNFALQEFYNELSFMEEEYNKNLSGNIIKFFNLNTEKYIALSGGEKKVYERSYRIYNPSPLDQFQMLIGLFGTLLDPEAEKDGFIKFYKSWKENQTK